MWFIPLASGVVFLLTAFASPVQANPGGKEHLFDLLYRDGLFQLCRNTVEAGDAMAGECGGLTTLVARVHGAEGIRYETTAAGAVEESDVEKVLEGYARGCRDAGGVFSREEKSTIATCNSPDGAHAEVMVTLTPANKLYVSFNGVTGWIQK